MARVQAALAWLHGRRITSGHPAAILPAVLLVTVLGVHPLATWAAEATVATGENVEWKFWCKTPDDLAKITGTWRIYAWGHAHCQCEKGGSDTIGPWDPQEEGGNKWDVTGGLPRKVTTPVGKSNTAKANHASAMAEASAQMDRAAETGEVKRDNKGNITAKEFMVQGMLTYPTSTWAERCPNGSHVSEANAKAGASVQFYWDKAQKQPAGAPISNGTVSKVHTVRNGKAFGPLVALAKAKDPISMHVVEVETGLEYEEMLLSVQAEARADEGEGGASWEFDELAGITLSTAGAGGGLGKVWISGDASSDWLVNPIGTFGASLIDGAFSATGAWEYLPWELTYEGAAVVGAYLPASEFSAAFHLDYQVPDLVMRDGYTYDVTVSFDDEWSECYAMDVPEPATTVLLLASGLGLLGRRRR